MKRVMAICLTAMLFLTVLGNAQGEILDELPLGTEAAKVREWINAREGQMDADSDEEIYFSAEGYSLFCTFDEVTGLMDWLNYSQDGICFPEDDYSQPDWRMKPEDLIASLNRQEAAYDLYVDDEGIAVFFEGRIFGLGGMLYFDFDVDGKLNFVKMEDEDTASALPWAAAMAQALGEPDWVSGLNDLPNGQMHDLLDSLTWHRNGCEYSLDHSVSFYCFEGDNGLESVFEADAVITVYPAEPEDDGDLL